MFMTSASGSSKIKAKFPFQGLPDPAPVSVSVNVNDELSSLPNGQMGQSNERHVSRNVANVNASDVAKTSQLVTNGSDDGSRDIYRRYNVNPTFEGINVIKLICPYWGLHQITRSAYKRKNILGPNHNIKQYTTKLPTHLWL